MTPDYQDRLAELLARMPHRGLLDLRAAAPSPQMQALLSPYEHRAFAREEVSQNPLSAIPLAGAIPAYQLQKLLTGAGARTPPSLDQMKQGYLGIWEGLNGR